MLNITDQNPGLLLAHQVIVYDRALPAGVWSPAARRGIEREEYACELWLMAGAHAAQFASGETRISELVTDEEAGLPSAGVLSAFLCAGEREYDHRSGDSPVGYMTTVQSESLPDNLYSVTLAEMRCSAAKTGALLHEWRTGAGECLSMLDVECLAREVRIEAFHLLAAGGLVIRTQSIFEID